MIWCVEDDDQIREMELYTLQMAGFETRGFQNGTSFLESLKEGVPSLLLLDIMLPKMDGVEILKRLRNQKYAFPIIMTTAKNQEYDKVQSLDLGADDYLVKPFGMMEMVSHVKAVLRRTNPVTSSQRIGNEALYMDLSIHKVFLNKEEIALTYKEFELLKIFLSHKGMAFSREELFAQVWQEDFMGESRTVDMHIRTLRQKLKEEGENIETIRHVGYRWKGDSQ